MGMPLVQIDDRRGPYDNIQTCYIRGAEIIKDVNSGKFPPIIHAQAFCVDKAAKVPEKKVWPPKVNINLERSGYFLQKAL